MVDFARSHEWTETDLLALVSEGVEENLNLDYKACPSLQKRDQERREISKDVSAFANAAGGIIVYGVIEVNNKPSDLDQGYNPGDISKEWVEHVIQGNIRPRIPGVHIHSVDLTRTRLGKVAYVVTIPQGKTAHQAADLKYYKRQNFESVAMYDHEIRDVMNRFTHPLVLPVFSLTLIPPTSAHKYKLNIVLKNEGATCARDVKLKVFWLRLFVYECGSGYRQRIIRGRIPVPTMETDNVELTIQPSNKPIFPEDELRLTDEDSRLDFTFQVNETILGTVLSQNPLLVWKVYADNMPPQEGSIPIGELEGFSRREHV